MKKLLLPALFLLAISTNVRAEEMADEQFYADDSQNVTAIEDDGSTVIPEELYDTDELVDGSLESLMDPNYLFDRDPRRRRPPVDRRPPGDRRPPHNPPPHNPPPRYPPPHNPPPRYPSTQYINCDSNNYRYAECFVGGYIRNAGISRQISRTSCQYGYSWGFYNDRIWVNHGCRATFWVETGRY